MPRLQRRRFRRRPRVGLDTQVSGYLEQHCYDCHDATTQKGDFRIDNLSPKVGVENSPQWLEIMERISSGEMPPKKVKVRPTAEESAKVVEWLATKMKEGEAARMALRPPVSYNRLTRAEYVNTVRDLLGVEFNATDPGAFLEDRSGMVASASARCSPSRRRTWKSTFRRGRDPRRSLSRKGAQTTRRNQARAPARPGE